MCTHHATNAIEYMVAVGLDDHLNTGGGRLSKKHPDSGLSGWVQMCLGIFHDQ